MLTYDMANRDGRSLQEHLYRCVRHDIARGDIAAGEKLPSKRSLAKHLGVSVITVAAAYDQLAAEGYLKAVQRSGYFACSLAPAVQPKEGPAACGEEAAEANARAARATLARRPVRPSVGSRLRSEPALAPAFPPAPAWHRNPTGPAGEDPSPLLADFASGSPATKLFPYAAWAKTMRATLSGETSESLAEAATAAGSYRLRSAIAHHLKRTRGLNAAAENIVVGSGAQTLYQLAAQLLGRDKVYAAENPGYPLLANLYRACGLRVLPLPLDEQGVSVEALRESPATVVHVTPAHQFPTGIVMSATRRRDLLNWTREAPGRYLMEDDYDGDFRLAGSPISPLQSIDAAERVVVVGSFAQTLGAAFRFGFMVLPSELAEKFATELGFYSNTVSSIDQLALARFIEEGHYERHVNRLRTTARRTQDALVGALSQACPSPRISFTGLGRGLHFVMNVDIDGKPAEGASRTIAENAGRKGIRLVPIQDYFASPPAANDSAARAQFVMNYGGIDAEDAPRIARTIASAIDEALEEGLSQA